MDEEIFRTIAEKYNTLVDNQALIASFGVLAGVVLTGMNISNDAELYERHTEFNEKLEEVINNLDKNPKDDMANLIVHAAAHVFDYSNFEKTKIGVIRNE